MGTLKNFYSFFLSASGSHDSIQRTNALSQHICICFLPDRLATLRSSISPPSHACRKDPKATNHRHRAAAKVSARLAPAAQPCPRGGRGVRCAALPAGPWARPHARARPRLRLWRRRRRRIRLPRVPPGRRHGSHRGLRQQHSPHGCLERRLPPGVLCRRHRFFLESSYTDAWNTKGYLIRFLFFILIPNGTRKRSTYCT